MAAIFLLKTQSKTQSNHSLVKDDVENDEKSMILSRRACRQLIYGTFLIK